MTDKELKVLLSLCSSITKSGGNSEMVIHDNMSLVELIRIMSLNDIRFVYKGYKDAKSK